MFCATCNAAESAPAAEKFTYVIVHGSTGGGWDWKKMGHLLTEQGHVVYRPTLTGLGERVHLSNPSIGLDTHVDDIVNLILFEDLHNVVLVGHSYAGMVITGVTDRIPDRIRHVVFLDATVPEDGESFMDVERKVGDKTPRPVVNGIYTPYWVNTNALPPCDVSQSYKTLTDPVSYKNPAAKSIPATCVLYLKTADQLNSLKENDANHYLQWRRAQNRGWTIRVLSSDHNAQKTHPRELAELLAQVPNDANHAPLKSLTPLP